MGFRLVLCDVRVEEGVSVRLSRSGGTVFVSDGGDRRG
jgi:hypothetical protein